MLAGNIGSCQDSSWGHRRHEKERPPVSHTEPLFKIFTNGPEAFERVRKLFRCGRCGQEVNRGSKWVPGASDSLVSIGCRCLTISFWELETQPPPDFATWRRYLELAKAHGVG
jgi:hypothetical protein